MAGDIDEALEQIDEAVTLPLRIFTRLAQLKGEVWMAQLGDTYDLFTEASENPDMVAARTALRRESN